MAINKFGQYVRLLVKDRSNNPVLETDSLRVDFDIRNTNGWMRAKISIFNLEPKVVKALQGGENYVTLTTSLHGGEEATLANELYVSNSIEEKQIPNSITSLFCYSKTRKASLEKRVDKYITQPSFSNVVKGILDAVGFKGEFKFKHFPKGYEFNLPKQPKSKQVGSAISCLEVLCKYHRAYFFIEGNDIIIMSKVHYDNRSYMDTGSEIKLNTDNMRSNPRIGPAVIDIQSNLDARIKPSVVLDISDLLTAGTGVDTEKLAVSAGIIKDVVAGWNLYQTFVVQHIGSNFTKDWTTRAHAIAPTQGYNMPINNWFK